MCKIDFKLCPSCNGNKVTEESLGYYEECERCDGVGYIIWGRCSDANVVRTSDNFIMKHLFGVGWVSDKIQINIS